MKTPSINWKGLLSWLLISLLLAAATCLNSWGQARIVDIANDTNDPTNLPDSEPSIAVNPQNTLDIVIVAFSDPWGAGTSAPVWKSNDGGFTWRKVTQIGAPSASLGGPGDQKIGFDAAGTSTLLNWGLSRQRTSSTDRRRVRMTHSRWARPTAMTSLISMWTRELLAGVRTIFILHGSTLD